MTFKYSFVGLLAILYIVHSQPVEQGPVLNDVPAEVLFRVDSTPKPLTLECSIESGDDSRVKYEWRKDGKPIDVASNKEVELQKGKLLVKEPKDSDAGKYQCLATTEAGIASRFINVKKTYIDLPTVAPTKSVRPVEGRPFQLDCQLPEGYPKPTIEWKRQSVSDGSDVKAIMNSRIFSPQGNLYFSNATKDDVSTDQKYVCFVKSPALDLEAPLTSYLVEGLAKDDKPKDNEVVKQFTSTDFTALVGDDTEIYCVYGGNPMPHPDWWKDGVNVNNSPGNRVTRYNRSKGKRLLIKETLPEDEGRYTCVIDNEVGSVQNHSLKLTVVSAPKFITKPEKRVSVKEGQDLFLPCEVLYLPKGEISWTHNASPAVSPRVIINDKGLTIKKIQKSDAGYYGCNAVNKFGGNFTESLVQVY